MTTTPKEPQDIQGAQAHQPDTKTTEPAHTWPVPRSDELSMLDGGTLEFRTVHGRLELRKKGEEAWIEVTLGRLFPLSEPGGWFAVLDKEDKELGVLEDMTSLSRDSAASLRFELRRQYMVPEIRRVVTCRTRLDLVEWDVETDRGRVTFLVKQHQEQPYSPMPNRIVITDIEGNTYDVPDISKLDPESQKALGEWF